MRNYLLSNGSLLIVQENPIIIKCKYSQWHLIQVKRTVYVHSGYSLNNVLSLERCRNLTCFAEIVCIIM